MLDDDEPEIIMVDDQTQQDLPDDLLADLEAGQPSELTVIKEVRYSKIVFPVVAFRLTKNDFICSSWVSTYLPT